MAYGWIIGIILLIVAGVSFYFVWQKFQFRKETGQWLPVMARLNNANFIKKSDESGRWWEITMDFEYQVQGQTFHNRATKKDEYMKKKEIKRINE